MTRLPAGCLLLTIACAGCGSPSAPTDTEKAPHIPIGTWTVASVEGAKNPGITPGMTVTISKSEFSAGQGGDKRVNATVVTMLPSKPPAQLDILIGESKYRGVYEVQGDEMWINFNGPGERG